ncbi:MAG: DUF5615 family PIN-like protein [Cytophagaceae bacterium]|nr:DUF5615 family PIN-like protein [Cytophagaceae bacterium]
MKLLFDQNISFRIVKNIVAQFPAAKQVKELGLENSTDREIWKYAKENDYAIVTFDGDFYELSSYFGHPPKIIWLRTGNVKTEDLSKVILDKAELIKEFLTNDAYKEIACIEIE